MRDRNRKNYTFQGSLLIGVIIIMLMISAISLAIVERTRNGLLLSIDTKEGYIGYQKADSEAERLLNIIKTEDSRGDKMIPENLKARLICSGGGVVCYNSEGNIIGLSGDEESKLYEISKIEKQGTQEDIRREILLATPSRVPNYISYDSFMIGQCGINNSQVNLESGCNMGSGKKSYNSCNLRLEWDNADVMENQEKISGYEVRRSHSEDGALANIDYGWVKTPTVFDIASSPNFSRATILNFNDESNSIADQYGKNYYYTIKLKNKLPFELDSLYLVENSSADILLAGERQKITLPNGPSCDGTDVINKIKGDLDGCYGGLDLPPGVEEAQFPNACCNGTTCYQAQVEWKESEDETCALQECQPSDKLLSENPTGPNYCGKSIECEDGQNCVRPYKTVSYCDTCPTAYPHWEKNNWTNVYRDPSGAFANNQATCCYQTCKPQEEVKADNPCGSTVGGYFTNNSYCTTQECGPKTDHKVCNISCNSGFSPAEDKTGYPNGSCCYQECPTFYCDKACSDGKCKRFCGGYEDTRSCFDMPACGSDPVCECGVSGSCFASCSGVVDTRSCVSKPLAVAGRPGVLAE